MTKSIEIFYTQTTTKTYNVLGEGLVIST